jgi:hypothetical protein
MKPEKYLSEIPVIRCCFTPLKIVFGSLELIEFLVASYNFTHNGIRFEVVDKCSFKVIFDFVLLRLISMG